MTQRLRKPLAKLREGTEILSRAWQSAAVSVVPPPVRNERDALLAVAKAARFVVELMNNGLRDSAEFITAIRELREALDRLDGKETQGMSERRHNVSTQSTADDPVCHDGWECEPGCDACAFAAESKQLRAELTRVTGECDRLRDDLSQLRSAWNAHMDKCSQHAALEVPTFEQIAEWQNAKSNTASAAVPPTQEREG